MQQWLQFVIPLLFVIIPIVGQIYRWSQNQAQERAIREERARRQRETLRTGRSEGGGLRPEPAASKQPGAGAAEPARPAQVSGRERLQELQAKRRAEIEARIRERRAQGASARLPTSSGPATAPSPVRRPANTQGGPVRVQPGRPSGLPQPPTRSTQARVPQPPAPVPVPVPSRRVRSQVSRPAGPDQAQRGRQQGQGQQRARPARDRPIDGVQGTPSEPSEVLIGSARRRRDLQASKDGSAGVAIEFAHMSREDWRKAILMREILGPPVGAREPGQLDDPLG